MDIAADAVFDVTAPAPRAPGEKAARAEAPDEPSFEDHLAPETDEAEPDAAVEAATPHGAAPVHIQLAAPPLLLQMMESAAPKNAPSSAAPLDLKTPAPTDLPATAPTPPSPPSLQGDAAPAAAAALTPPPTTASATPIAPPQPSKGAQAKASGPKSAPAEPIDTTRAAPLAAPVNPAPAPIDIAAPAPTTPTPTAPAQDPRAAGASALEPARGAENANITLDQTKPNAAPPTATAPKSSNKIAAPVVAASEPASAPRTDTLDATMLGQSALASTSHTAAQTQQATLEHSAERAAPAAQVGREIVRRFQGESTRFELRLDPPELGRIEVRLDVSRDNRVTAIVSADNPQALTDLVRHARELEQSLQAAGLELSENGLSFDLRQQSDTSRQAEQDIANKNTGAMDGSTPEPIVAARPLGFERWRGLRVDVMA